MDQLNGTDSRWMAHSPCWCPGLDAVWHAFARKHDSDPRFSFGTGKVFALTGFGSAIALFVAGALVAAESVHHILEPESMSLPWQCGWR